MARNIELFSAGCPLCSSLRDEIELGKCGQCRVEVVDVRDPASSGRMKAYDVRVIPTVVIDGRVKVEGRFDEPWVCDDAFFTQLTRSHPLRLDTGPGTQGAVSSGNRPIGDDKL